MATIDIHRPHTLDKDEAKRRAEALMRSMEDKLGIRWSWDGDRIRFDAPSGAAKGATGLVIVGQSQVRIEIDLPFVLRAVKGSVASKIEKKLDRLIG